MSGRMQYRGIAIPSWLTCIMSTPGHLLISPLQEQRKIQIAPGMLHHLTSRKKPRQVPRATLYACVAKLSRRTVLQRSNQVYKACRHGACMQLNKRTAGPQSQEGWPEDGTYTVTLCKVAVGANVHAEATSCKHRRSRVCIMCLTLVMHRMKFLTSLLARRLPALDEAGQAGNVCHTGRQLLHPPGSLATCPWRKAFQGVTALALQVDVSITGFLSPQSCAQHAQVADNARYAKGPDVFMLRKGLDYRAVLNGSWQARDGHPVLGLSRGALLTRPNEFWWTGQGRSPDEELLMPRGGRAS